MEVLQEGDVVTYVDPRGVPRPALVTAVWGASPDTEDREVGVNLVFVSGDPERKDPYGRQVERETSVVHEDSQPAHGNFWRRA